MRRKLQPIFRMGGLILTIVPFALQAETSRNLLMEAITKELERSVKALKKVEGPPLYFLQYHITDREEVNLSSSYGTLKGEEKEKRRYLRVDARVGSPLLDNTHELRGGFFDYSLYIPSEKEISLEDDPASIRGALWAETDRVFKEAQERFIKVETEKKVKVEEEDPSPDFSREEPNQFFGEPAKLEFDPKPWVEILKRLSLRFKKEPWILSSLVSLRANATTRYIANSEGTKIIEGATGYYLRIFAETVAEDGMEDRKSVV